jgi:hypothetical protein
MGGPETPRDSSAVLRTLGFVTLFFAVAFLVISAILLTTCHSDPTTGVCIFPYVAYGRWSLYGFGMLTITSIALLARSLMPDTLSRDTMDIARIIITLALIAVTAVFVLESGVLGFA